VRAFCFATVPDWDSLKGRVVIGVSFGDCLACVTRSKLCSPFLAGVVDAALRMLDESRAAPRTVVLVK
jgi:hypothetical protein